MENGSTDRAPEASQGTQPPGAAAGESASTAPAGSPAAPAPPHPVPVPAPPQYRYLPWLSLSMVVLTLAWFAQYYLARPSGEQRKRIEAFSQALRLIPENYDGAADEHALYEAAMKGMVYSLNDSHSFFLDRFELSHTDAQTEGEFGGVGVVVEPGEGAGIVVEVVKGSPAEKAGIKAGDIIVAVDDVETSRMTYIELISRVRGKDGSRVKLTLQHAGKEGRATVELKRYHVTLDTVTWKMLDGGIGYIKIGQFDVRVLDNVRKGLDELKNGGNLKALLLDVRDNNGGLLEQAVGVADMFLADGPIVRLKGRHPSKDDVFEAKSDVAVPVEMPLAILVDRGSASASEVVAGALQARGRATLVGTRTFGKGAVNNIFVLADGSGLLLTVAHYTVGEGKEIEGKGIEPDIKLGELPPPPMGSDEKTWQEWRSAYQAAQKDQFERAVEFLKAKVSPETSGEK